MLKRFMSLIALSVILFIGMVGCGDASKKTCGDKNISTSEDISSEEKLKNLISELEKASEVAITASLVGVEDDDKISFGDGSISPFERIAVLDVVRDANGTIDYQATNKKASSIATQIALSVATIDEPQEDSDTFKSSDWVVIDKKKEGEENLTAEDMKSHIIHIPTSKTWNPHRPYSTTNTNKVHLVELSNSNYASQAIGYKIIGGEDGAKIPNGKYHSTALPCEVTVYSDNRAIYVDMLNPEAIFTLFFSNLFSNDVMKNEKFKTALMELPTQVKKEVIALIYNSLDSQKETYTKTEIKMGAIFSSLSKATTISTKEAPYTHYNYKGDKEYTSTDAKRVAVEIMNAMTISGDSNAGVQEEPLLSTLPSMAQTKSVQPKWRSAREEPFKISEGVWIVEACSPVYAKKVLSTGEYHAPALPYEIAVNVNPDNNRSINISILNPDFVFNALFFDSMKDMSSSQIAEFQVMIDNINGDLSMIIDYAIEHKLTGLYVETKKELIPIE